jgi:AraC-like DNA-binding protein
MRSSSPRRGVELLEAHFASGGYARHRHDTYGISVTDYGVQRFYYRGRSEASLPGQVAILHPDESHDGRAGTAEGFRYRIVYLTPEVVAAAIRSLHGRERLPFVSAPVIGDADLAACVRSAFTAGAEPLAWDAVIVRLVRALMRHSAEREREAQTIDTSGLDRAREYLRSARHVVRSSELERISGLTRYDLTRQFHDRYGTTPYRYSVLRRLDFARHRLVTGTSIAEAALDAGFADQPHFTRMFRATYGITPGHYLALASRPRSSREGGDA